TQRILFQMSATDSSHLMDSPVAARLGRNRALFHREEQEQPEKFRPYGLPSQEWLNWAKEQLRKRAKVKTRPSASAECRMQNCNSAFKGGSPHPRLTLGIRLTLRMDRFCGIDFVWWVETELARSRPTAL